MENSIRTTPAAAPRAGETSWLWLVKIVTGPLLILVLILHFAVNHYIGSASGLMTYDEIVQYYQNPIIPAIEIIFLVTVVAHSLIGLRGIILDLKPSRSALRILDWVFILVGIASVVYGTWLAFAIVAQGG